MPLSTEITWEKIRKLAPFPQHLAVYYKSILKQYEDTYNSAEKARSKGLDPTDHVESKTVFDLADRVNQMLGLDQFQGLSERLRELLKLMPKETVALTIAQEIALGKFGIMEIKKALEYSVRTGLAIITDGVTVAPVQGIYSVAIKRNDDNSKYASISYAGPMRSAGGTEAAFSLIIGDLVAKKIGLSNYIAKDEEIGRFIEELRVYEREVGNFQYRISDEDVRLAISNLPIEIDGVETDPVEVVVHRNLNRVSTDRVRGGALRVLNDGIIGRAHKLVKILAELNIQGWGWLNQLKGGKQQTTNETEQTDAHFDEVISGRAVLAFPNTKGGFRIRYGRAMNTGLSTIGIHPAVAALLDYPVVVGTQVKVDLPGKAATIAFVDSIEGPTVLLRNGSVKKIEDVKEAEELRNEVFKIIDLGDALISFGDFLENNKTLPPSPYVEEWWFQELQTILSTSPNLLEELIKEINYNRLAELNYSNASPHSAEEALILSKILKIPLYPKFTYRFDAISVTDILKLRKNMKVENGDIIVNITSHDITSILQKLLVPYELKGQIAKIKGEPATILVNLLDIQKLNILNESKYKNSLELIKELSGIKISRQNTTTIGMRVGRPEKAMLRHLKPPVHVLFPVGFTGGSTRDLKNAAKVGVIKIDIVNIICPSCEKRKFIAKCQECNEATIRFLSCPKCNQSLNTQTCPNCKIAGITHSGYSFNIGLHLQAMLKTINGLRQKQIKGVKGLTSESKIPELIEKGVLRSKHDIYVYKDGTCRIDVTNAPLTHFRPIDINVDIQILEKLEYKTDIYDKPLTKYDQILELKPQDIIIPQSIANDLVKIAKFIDEEFTFIYKLEPFYNVNKTSDLIGKMLIGLAPHTSVGVIGRVIGFTNSQVCYANPCWHAAKRRDCDGDGDSLLLLLDVLLNFSVEYIPNQIGGLMDTPLLIQPIILPSEVDAQAHNFDVASKYPIEFYETTQTSPNSSAVANLIERIGNRLDKEEQFYNYGFTKNTNIIPIKHSRSAYSALKTLNEKILKQIEVADKIGAVSTKDVVESIIKTHLLRDILGNMKKYSTQSFKCKQCGLTFRRPLVSGRCNSCKGELRGTLSKASVEKYLALAQRLANDYGVDEYIKNRLELIIKELDQLFQRNKSTQLELTEFN
jgi:DNA polymerase II large subunit